MAELPPLPPGFTLDAQPAADIPPLPPGFTLDAAPGAQPRGPQEGDATHATGAPEGFHSVTGDDGRQTLRRNLGARDIAQSVLDLPGVGTAANLATGAYNTGVKAISGLAGIFTGGNPEVVRGTQEALRMEPAQTRDPISQGFGLAQRGAEKITAPAERAVAGMSPGARTAIEATAEAIPDVAGVLGARVPLKIAATRMAEVRTARAARPQVPSAEDLAKAAEQAYQRADAAGVVIAPQSMTRAAASVREAAGKQNLNPKLHPKAAAAVEHLEEVAAKGQPLTLKEADQLRQVVKDAQTSIEKADRRMAGIVLRRFDDYLAKLSPEDTLAGRSTEGVAALNEARTIYRRKSNAETIDEMIRRAEVNAGAKYTQAGMEHALRSEFKKLAMNEKKMRLFTPEQRAAIEKVARGGPVENALRNLGKFDPTQGGMATYLATTLGGGAGYAAGDIGTAAAGAGALSALGILGRRGATRMTAGNVERAREALVGRGLPESAPRSSQVKQPAEPEQLGMALAPGFGLEAPPGVAPARIRRPVSVPTEQLEALAPLLDLIPPSGQVPARIMPSTPAPNPSMFPDVFDLAPPSGRAGSRIEQLALQDRAFMRERETAARSASDDYEVAESPAENVVLESPGNRLQLLSGGKAPPTISGIESEMRQLERRAKSLPSDSPTLRAIDARYEVLREELALAKSRGRRNRVGQLAEVQ